MDMLNKIITWAQKENAVRALILTGSRANDNNKKIDQFSDFDIALFVTDQPRFSSNASWISLLGTVWVQIPEQIQLNDFTVPTHLVIFEGGIGVDFALWSTDQLATLVAQAQLPFACENGYNILVDKDGLAKQLPKAEGQPYHCIQPTQKEFLSAINIFFFEAFNCAKYLARGDLWHAKLRDWTTKEYLLKMIEWNQKAIHGLQYKTYWHGKHMQSWVDKETWVALDNCFAHFDAEDSRKALMATIELFGRVGKQTAELLGYQYPTDVDENITRFVKKIGPKGA